MDLGALSVFSPSTALSLGGSYLGYKGVEDTNVTNKDIASARNAMEIKEAQKAREFSGNQAKINREFQKTMSNTQVQRRMADLQKAGINPILAGKFEASSPAGGIGATAKANAHGYEAKNKMAGALDRMSTALDIKQKIANIANTEANTEITGTKEKIINPLSDLMEMLGLVSEDATTTAKDNYPVLIKKLKDTIIDKGKKLKNPVNVFRKIPSKSEIQNYYRRKPLSGER